MAKMKEAALEIYEMYEQGFSINEIADRTGHTLDFVNDSLKVFGVIDDLEDEFI
jgi:hypothetical protein